MQEEKGMLDLSKGQLMLYGGIGLIVAATVAAIVCIVIFVMTGKKIQGKLEHDYGKMKD